MTVRGAADFQPDTQPVDPHRHGPDRRLSPAAVRAADDRGLFRRRPGLGAGGRRAGGLADFAVAELVSALGSDMRRRLEPVAVSGWGVDPWSQGAYSHALPGHAADRARLRVSVEDRLFLAGEATAPVYYGTAHGAWMEGERAADAALSALGVPARPPPGRDRIVKPVKPRKPAAKATARRPAVMTGASIPILRWPPDEDRVEEIFERLSGVMPDPRTELNFSNPYTLVVAVALSAQATDVSVNKATDRLFQVADTPEKMLALGEEGLISYIASIGLYRGKARNVIALSRIVPGAARRPSPPEPRRPSGPARRGAKDGLGGAERTGDRGGHRRRHPRLSRLPPAGSGQCGNAGQGGGPVVQGGAGRLAAQGAPLADPAWSLHLHGAKTQMPVVRDRRPVSVAGGAYGVGGSRSAALKASGPFTSLSDRAFSTRRAAAMSASDTSWNIRWRMAEAWTSKSFTACWRPAPSRSATTGRRPPCGDG